MNLPHQPRKRFGQHFLHDSRVIGRIVAAIDPRPGDRMVEIGPGLGALTCPLLERLDELQTVELDRDVIPRLEARCTGPGRLVVHQADALRFDFAALASGPRSLRVVGNLPYNVSTPLVFHLLSQREVIRDMHFLLQKEVVERLAARPGTGQYGRLSVMVQYYCRAERLFAVGPGAFRPPPKVDSAVVRLVPHDTLPWPAHDESLLADLVRRAFSQRRKTLRKALGGLAEAADFAAAGIDPGLRGERLSVEQFVRLANALAERKAGTGTEDA